MMDEITINLSKHEFNDGIKQFKDPEVVLKRKNFIFAKNGSGKSTFASVIRTQLSDSHDVPVYNGFDSILGERTRISMLSLWR
ncbi:hypothetical protein NIE32_05010 [Sporolactobacillus kofuensis]|uniref:hypothetical protein n=1 Tax=Sporolactobacillus kofuensis TaxID=269672 RepID=UPI0020974900|nr:hypothetical protein [Sporolactobacillus kofuensis]MCO7175472.1 hypothetical protein [Sporolactobacillus kofuensis]